MKPGRLYERDFNKLTEEEKAFKEEKKTSAGSILLTKPSNYYPAAVRHNLSMFPNNHLELMAIKEEADIVALNTEFHNLISEDGCLERDVLNFINQTPAYHIIGSILHDRFHFGHHELYLFKEMWLGDNYRTDYVLVGKGSGGYEFVLIEFEKPEGRITLKDGHLGEAFRKGNYQVEDWQIWMDANFAVFAKDLLSVCNGELIGDIPVEFKEYDHTRFHYVVIAGRRSDFNVVTYRTARDKLQRTGNYLLHHDTLYEDSMALTSMETF